jgi:flavin reductase (DIM6/NTAB) family NADH-FMN oxidoreductase RutF
MRRELPIDELPPGLPYRLMTASVLPRPIAWVSSRSAAGVDNLAPHSFFTVASSAPPVLQFTSIGHKDTVRNIEETGEFVICVAPLGLMAEINETGTNLGPEIDEFDYAGVAREPSAAVGPMRVAASPVAFECRLRSITEIGNGIVVLGDVVHIAVAETVIGDDGLPLADRLDLVARLGRNEWAGLGEILRLDRPQPHSS